MRFMATRNYSFEVDLPVPINDKIQTIHPPSVNKIIYFNYGFNLDNDFEFEYSLLNIKFNL